VTSKRKLKHSAAMALVVMGCYATVLCD